MPSTPSNSHLTASELIDVLEFKVKLLQLTDDDVRRLGGVLTGEKQWDDLKESLAQDLRDRQMRFYKGQFRDEAQSTFVTQWLERNVADADERYVLKFRIVSLWSQRNNDELREYLVDALEHGYKTADKKRKRRLGGGYWGHAWVALAGIARVLLTLVILSASNSDFETIVFALLIMIYCAIYGVNSAQHTVGLARYVQVDRQLWLLRQGLDKDHPDTKQEERNAAEVEATQTVNREAVRYWIRGSFDSVIWLIAILALLRAALA